LKQHASTLLVTARQRRYNACTMCRLVTLEQCISNLLGCFHEFCSAPSTAEHGNVSQGHAPSLTLDALVVHFKSKALPPWTTPTVIDASRCAAQARDTASARHACHPQQHAWPRTQLLPAATTAGTSNIPTQSSSSEESISSSSTASSSCCFSSLPV
jgi:hypothetical protein